MERKYCVDPLKCVISAITAACFALIGGCLLDLGRWVSAAVFLALAAVFCGLAAANGATIHIDSTHIWRTVLGVKTRGICWNDVAEVVVTGTKVFNQRHPERTGNLYIYFSPQPLTDEERFGIMLKWPPEGKIYLLYNAKRILEIQTIWSSKIQTFNAGNIAL